MLKSSLYAKKKKNYNIAFQISATHETCSMLSGRRLSYSMLIYNYKLKKLRHFFKTLSGMFQSGGGEGGWRDGVGSLFQQFGDRFFVKAFSTSLLKPKNS